MADFFQSELGKAAIAIAVVERMGLGEVQKLFRESIDQPLASAVGAMMKDLRSKADRTIVTAGAPAMQPVQMAKEGYAKLQEFIRKGDAPQSMHDTYGRRGGPLQRRRMRGL